MGKGVGIGSVVAGRACVQAYVPYLHFVERLYTDAATPIAHGAGDIGVSENAHPGPVNSPHSH